MEELLGSTALRTIVQRWRWLLVGTLVPVAVVAAALMLQAPSYASTVSLVSQRARTEVNYDTRIRTVSSDGALTGQGSPTLPTVSAERRQALVQLVRSAEIEQEVRSRIGDALPAELRIPGQLGKLVHARVVPRSEVIAIEVVASQPALAERIAQVWSQVYEQRVNDLYGASPVGALKLEPELGEARQKYQVAEDALTAFVATETVGQLSRDAEAKQRLLRELITVRQTEVIDLYKIAHRVELLITQAQALQQQLAEAQDNSSAATNAAALSLLKTQAFASSMSLPTGLQLQLPDDTTASQSRGDASPPPVGNAANEPPQDPASVARSLQDWTLPGNLQLQLPQPATTATLAQQRADVAVTISAFRIGVSAWM